MGLAVALAALALPTAQGTLGEDLAREFADWPGTPTCGTGLQQGTSTTAAVYLPGCLEWMVKLGGSGFDHLPNAAFLSADGSTIHAAGTFEVPSSPYSADRIGAAAFRTYDGALLWQVAHRGSAADYAGFSDFLRAPDGSRLYLAGDSVEALRPGGYYRHGVYTAALDPLTGEVLWSDTYMASPFSLGDTSNAAVLSPDGAALYHGGRSFVAGSANEALLLRYDAATGALQWAVATSVAGSPNATAAAIAVSPDGAFVYVGAHTDGDLRILVYRASDGGLLAQWAAYPGLPEGLHVSADGTRLVLLARNLQHTGLAWFRATAYDLPSGALAWTYEVPRADDYLYWRLQDPWVWSPDGSVLYLGSPGPAGYGQVHAVNAADGSAAWVWTAPLRWTQVHGIADSGEGVYVAGSARGWEHTRVFSNHTDMLLVALERDDGSPRWSSRAGGYVYDRGIVPLPAPDREAVFLVGQEHSGSPFSWLVARFGTDGGTL